MKAHQKYFAFIMMVLSVMLASMAARAQNSAEVSCRSKAKETALQIYQGCMAESRAAQIQSIREGYRSELANVKAKYEGMLKDVKGDTTTAKAAAVPAVPVKTAAAAPVAPVRAGKAEQPVAGIAKSLPAKQNDNGPALPVQNPTSDVSVVEPDLGDESGF